MLMKQEEIVQTYRPLLFSIAYNMAGSVVEAEDCVQETCLRWYAASRDQEAEVIQNPKGYLCTVITRVCIDEWRQARRQRESCVGDWLPKPLVSEEMSVCSDGGGKVKGARRPLCGECKAARFLLAVKHKVAELVVYRLVARINGQPGIISYQQEVPYSVMVFDIAEQKIREVNVIVNPDKLRHILPPCQGTRT